MGMTQELLLVENTLTAAVADFGMYDRFKLNLLASDPAATTIPDVYVKPENDRPCLAKMGVAIPVIDMSKLYGDDQAEMMEQLKQACEEWGVFQVINHDFPESCMQSMMEISRQFFELPVEKRMQYYSNDPSSGTRYGISYNANKESCLDWRDFLIQLCHPLSDQLISTWPDMPLYRDVSEMYSRNMQKLVLRLLAVLSESLGLSKEYLALVLKDHDHKMLMNHYPPCPQPELTLGVSRHTDPNIITVLQQDEVGGLQVLRKGTWIAVRPIPNALVVNMGDQMQIISNGGYQCVEHRAVVNSTTTRFSIASFYAPSMDATIGPAPQLIDQDHPAQYRQIMYGDYLRAFRAKGPNKKAYIQSVRI